MLRMARNRWCAFLLTLGVLASIATFPPPSYGGAGDSDVMIEDPRSMPGDPDGTQGPGKRAPAPNRASPGGNGHAAASVGDGGSALRVWSGHFHVVLRSLISRFYRL